MKKFFNLIRSTAPFAVLFVLSLFLTACPGPEPDEDKDTPSEKSPLILLNKTELTLEIGKTERLEATFDPFDTPNKAHTWSSSDQKIATVDETGLVTAVAEGEATIEVKALNGGHRDFCVVTVVKKKIPVTSVSLNKTSASIIEGDTIHLSATIKPTDATDQAISWMSSDNLVASVDENGVVKGETEGKATITATTNDGQKTANCEVTVKFRGVRFSNVKISNVTNNSADISGSIELSGVTATEIGCQYSTSATPSGSDVKVKFSNGKTSGTLTGLKQKTTYYARLYAIVNGEHHYSDVVSFETVGELKTKFALTDVYIDELVMESPICEGYSSVKVCYSTTPSPKVTDKNATATISGDKLKLDIKNLSQGTKYYIRSFQEIGGKIEYSKDEVCFETISDNLNSGCFVSYSLSGIGQVSIPYALSAYTQTVDYKIKFSYKINGSSLFKIGLINCFRDSNSSDYIEAGAGNFIYYRQFYIAYYSSSGRMLAQPATNSGVYINLLDTDTGITYHCITTGLSYTLYIDGNLDGKSHRYSGTWHFD